MCKLLVVLSAFLLSTSVIAGIAEDKQIVYERVRAYADLITCRNSFENFTDDDGVFYPKKTTINDVFWVERSEDDTSVEYFVFWDGDLGCQSASGSDSAFVTVASKNKYGNDGKFYIMDDFAFGDIGINYRFIESVRQTSKDKFLITAWDYADERFGGVDGGNNFPVNKFEYTVERSNQSIYWIVTNQRLIEQKQYRNDDF